MSDAEDDYFGADNGIDNQEDQMGDALDDHMGGGGWPFASRPTARRYYERHQLTSRPGKPGLSSERAHIEREMEKLRTRSAELDEAANRFGAEPPVGTIVDFRKHFPGSLKTYSYAALRVGPERKVGGGWFLTGRDGAEPRTWEWVCDFIGDGPFRVIPPETSKNAAVDSVELRATKRPGDEFPSFEQVPGPGESGYNAAKFEGGVRHKNHNPVAPFIAAPGKFTGDWLVLDLRKPHFDNQVVRYFAGSDGERRARQSAADHNRIVWKTFRNGPHLTFMPPGSRVRSKTNPKLWAQCGDDGRWTRYNGSMIQSIGLSQDSMLRQLSRAIEPIPASA